MKGILNKIKATGANGYVIVDDKSHWHNVGASNDPENLTNSIRKDLLVLHQKKEPPKEVYVFFTVDNCTVIKNEDIPNITDASLEIKKKAAEKLVELVIHGKIVPATLLLGEVPKTVLLSECPANIFTERNDLHEIIEEVMNRIRRDKFDIENLTKLLDTVSEEKLVKFAQVWE